MARIAWIASAVLFLAAAPAAANDSEAAFGLGGLTLVRNDSISMDSEDLYISHDEVRVAYRFTNRSNRNIEALVSFPIPGLPTAEDSWLGDASMPDFREFKFRTTIDGKPVRLDFSERAEAAGRDVTARIGALGWPIRWYEGYGGTLAFVDKLSAEDKAAYLREGLLRRSADDPGTLLPAWKLVTHVTRRQIFPAGKTVAVTHSYRPIAGGSVAGGLDKGVRKSGSLEAYRREYCTDNAFFAAFDRRMAATQGLFYSETWIDYILKSGANWRGPIGDFRLVVDKGKADSLVSFCMDGVRKIAPTRFEVRKRNFEPLRDLDVLIVDFVKPE